MKIQARNVQTNISSVIGNATSFYIEYLKRLFPPGFFKDSFISGTLPSIEREAKDFINRAKPTLIVRPEYNAESGIMGELPIWHNAYQYVFKNSKSDDMTKFIVDSMERSDFSLYKFTCEVK